MAAFEHGNEWVLVERVEGEPTESLPDQPITVMGVIEVGEVMRYARIDGLYRLKADRAGPLR